MELPINLERANTFLDASEAIRFHCQSKDMSKRCIRRLGQSHRLAITTAHNLQDGSSRGGCIVLHRPRSVREALRWVDERGMGEEIDGFGTILDSSYLVRQNLGSFRGAFSERESNLNTNDRQKKRI